MARIIKQGPRLPEGYLEEAVEEFFRIYALEDIAGEDLKQDVTQRNAEIELVHRYFINDEKGLNVSPKELAREVLESSFKKLGIYAENKMINFVRQNYGAYDYNEILKKIKDYVPTQKNLDDGITTLKLTEANLQLSKFMSAYEEFINWLKADPANYKAITIIGNYFMGVKELFNKTNS